MPQGECGGLQKHTLAQIFFAEVFTAGYGQFSQLVFLALGNDVLNRLLVIDDGLDAEVYVDIVVTLTLKLVSKVAGSFNQQVIVDCAFLKHRNIPSQHAFGHLRLQGFDPYLRSGIDV